MSHDYLMRQIEEAAKALASILLNKKLEVHAIIDEDGNLSHGDFLLYNLKKLALQGKINEAENLLFDAVEQNPCYEYLQAALTFYEQLMQMDDKALHEYDFSRQEVLDGLQEIRHIYGLSLT